jgi:GH15 family glucan-1,4-alpha-glucosidase
VPPNVPPNVPPKVPAKVPAKVPRCPRRSRDRRPDGARLRLRYRTDETDDGLSGKEGTFLICSFWLVSALAIIGHVAEKGTPMADAIRVGEHLIERVA